MEKISKADCLNSKPRLSISKLFYKGAAVYKGDFLTVYKIVPITLILLKIGLLRVYFKQLTQVFLMFSLIDFEFFSRPRQYFLGKSFLTLTCLLDSG